jgi:hypothetical protein
MSGLSWSVYRHLVGTGRCMSGLSWSVYLLVNDGEVM